MADMKIAEFCNPIFEQIVLWGRESDANSPLDVDGARTTLNGVLDRLRLASRQQPKLGQQFVQVELPLLFFIDFVMQDRIALSGEWSELAFEQNELAGDEKFFDLLEQTLGSPTDNATDRVEVYYQCMSLGFSGTYEQQSPELHRLFRRCALRLGLSPELVESGQLTPEAYDHLDLVSKHRPFDPRRWRWAVVICLGAFLVTHLTNQWFFHTDISGVQKQLERIGTYSNLAPPPMDMSSIDPKVVTDPGDDEAGSVTPGITDESSGTVGGSREKAAEPLPTPTAVPAPTPTPISAPTDAETSLPIIILPKRSEEFDTDGKQPVAAPDPAAATTNDPEATESGVDSGDTTTNPGSSASKNAATGGASEPVKASDQPAPSPSPSPSPSPAPSPESSEPASQAPNEETSR
jgi:hypothetical protein